jgi:TetR/AcrR family hemagglutinin/protease transcriptional regulator
LPPAERRAQLLACALRVFARRGLGEARHAEIAKEGGVSLSSVFFYFPTRAALVGAVLDEVERFYLTMAEQIHEGGLPVPRVLWEHAVVFAESVDSHPDYARVWLDWSTAIRDEVWPRYLGFQERLVSVLRRTVARGQREGAFAADVDAEDVARFLVSSAHMVAQMKFTRCAPERVERFMRTVIRAAIGGLLSDSSTAPVEGAVNR